MQLLTPVISRYDHEKELVVWKFREIPEIEFAFEHSKRGIFEVRYYINGEFMRDKDEVFTEFYCSTEDYKGDEPLRVAFEGMFNLFDDSGNVYSAEGTMKDRGISEESQANIRGRIWDAKE